MMKNKKEVNPWVLALNRSGVVERRKREKKNSGLGCRVSVRKTEEAKNGRKWGLKVGAARPFLPWEMEEINQKKP